MVRRLGIYTVEKPGGPGGKLKMTSGNNITTQLGKDGLGEQPWWVLEWMELINSYRYKKRLERAWIYAREGNVVSIRFEGRRVQAEVQGTESEPYKVQLWLDVLTDEDWEFVLEALSQKARWACQLLAGIMPQDIERAFAASGRRLFPFKLEEVGSECSCPDKANPCKHISAVYYLMGDRFTEDPFVLFQLRGRSRKQLLQALAEKRKIILQTKQEIAGISINQAIENYVDAAKWWQYNSPLDPDLVVITPALESSGLAEAGDLPLAEEPLYPQAKQIFLEHLLEHSNQKAQAAMLLAMATDSN